MPHFAGGRGSRSLHLARTIQGRPFGGRPFSCVMPWDAAWGARPSPMPPVFPEWTLRVRLGLDTDTGLCYTVTKIVRGGIDTKEGGR
jgi:hypothetical protein